MASTKAGRNGIPARPAQCPKKRWHKGYVIEPGPEGWRARSPVHPAGADGSDATYAGRAALRAAIDRTYQP